MGISTRPVLLILPPRAKTLVPLDFSVPMEANHSGSVEDDLRDVGIGFNVVEDGGLVEQTLDRRERRTGTRLAALALDGLHQSGLFAADECAGAQTDVQIKVEAGAKNVLAQQAVFACLR